MTIRQKTMEEEDAGVQLCRSHGRERAICSGLVDRHALCSYLVSVSVLNSHMLSA